MLLDASGTRDIGTRVVPCFICGTRSGTLKGIRFGTFGHAILCVLSAFSYSVASNGVFH